MILTLCQKSVKKGLIFPHGILQPEMDAPEILQNFEKQIPGFFGAVVGPPEGPVAELHAKEWFPAASLIKIPILLYLLKEHERGNLALEEIMVLKSKDKVAGSGVLLELHDGIPLSILDLATLMIVVSDNIATNLLIDRLGLEKTQDWIKQTGLTQTLLGRKMMAAPEAHPANFTSPWDMYLAFQKLAAGSLLSPPNTKLAFEILSRQQYNEKIPLFLPKEARVAHKTGEISGVRHDCGMVQHGGRKLIVSLLTKGVADEVRTDRVLAELSKALYDHYFVENRKPSS